MCTLTDPEKEIRLKMNTTGTAFEYGLSLSALARD
jgi:hypothetical protein